MRPCAFRQRSRATSSRRQSSAAPHVSSGNSLSIQRQYRSSRRGTFALQSVTGHKKASIMKSRGFVWQKDGRDIMPTTPPSSRIVRRFAGTAVLEGHPSFSSASPRRPHCAVEAGQLLRPEDGQGGWRTFLSDSASSSLAISRPRGSRPPKPRSNVSEYRTARRRSSSRGTRRSRISFNGSSNIELLLVTTSSTSIQSSFAARHRHQVDRRYDGGPSLLCSTPAQVMDHLVSFYENSEPWEIVHGMSGKDEKGQPKKKAH